MKKRLCIALAVGFFCSVGCTPEASSTFSFNPEVCTLELQEDGTPIASVVWLKTSYNWEAVPSTEFIKIMGSNSGVGGVGEITLKLSDDFLAEYAANVTKYKNTATADGYYVGQVLFNYDGGVKSLNVYYDDGSAYLVQAMNDLNVIIDLLDAAYKEASGTNNTLLEGIEAAKQEAIAEAVEEAKGLILLLEESIDCEIEALKEQLHLVYNKLFYLCGQVESLKDWSELVGSSKEVKKALDGLNRMLRHGDKEDSFAEAVLANIKKLDSELEKLARENAAQWHAIGKNVRDISNLEKAVSKLNREDYRIKKDIEDLEEDIEDIYETLKDKFDGMYGMSVVEYVKWAFSKYDDKLWKEIREINWDIKGLKRGLNNLRNIVETLAEEINTMITAMSIVSGTVQYSDIVFDGILDYYLTTVRSNESFGPNNEITFTEGTFEGTTTASIVVQVTPTNASLAGAEFVLQDSKGTPYTDHFKTITAQPFNEGVLTKAAATGLWLVTFEIENVNNLPKNNVILALGKENDITGSNDRWVFTNYGITITKKDDIKPVYFAHERNSGHQYKYGPIFWMDDNIFVNWILNESDKKMWSDPGNLATTDPSGWGKEADNRDDYSDYDPLWVRVNSGQPANVTITLDSKLNSRIKAWYVMADIRDNERSNWKGLGTLNMIDATPTVGNTITITTPTRTILLGGNDYRVVTFTVYAVNHDGTLVDPDGIDFIVVFED